MSMCRLKDYDRVLLVNPAFPKNRYSKHHNFVLPIGLIKIGTYYQNKGAEVKLIWIQDENSIDELIDFNPEIIYITSLFTYWAKYVKDAVSFCKRLFPNIEVIVGGVYASLSPDECKEYTCCDTVLAGILYETEGVPLDYSLLGVHQEDLDYQIIHTSRGCIRDCKYCSGNVIEKEFTYKKSILNEITHRKLLFYDNNILANPYIEDILNELISLKTTRQISFCESRTGFDYRIINQNPKLVTMLKQAGFREIKIAWDHGLQSQNSIKKCIDYFTDAGYRARDIGVYMLSNYDLPYSELEKKRAKCAEWGTMVINCRFIPLDAHTDGYNPRLKHQSPHEYYIAPNWTDLENRTFAKNVRRTNQCSKYYRRYYSRAFERKQVPKEEYPKFKAMTFEEAKKYFDDAWNPYVPHQVIEKNKQTDLESFK